MKPGRPWNVSGSRFAGEAGLWVRQQAENVADHPTVQEQAWPLDDTPKRHVVVLAIQPAAIPPIVTLTGRVHHGSPNGLCQYLGAAFGAVGISLLDRAARRVDAANGDSVTVGGSFTGTVPTKITRTGSAIEGDTTGSSTYGFGVQGLEHQWTCN
jgi:hypothetical protein